MYNKWSSALTDIKLLKCDSEASQYSLVCTWSINVNISSEKNSQGDL